MISASEASVILLLTISTIGSSRSSIGNWESCGGRLERALDAIQRDSSGRNTLEEEQATTFYQQELRSAPLEMLVSRIVVKLPRIARDTGNPWARVEKCIYKPSDNSLQTRVMLNDLSVSGVVSLMPRDREPPVPAESCRMTLRLRRAGVDFLTSPIARGRGQMRIRTESSFLEPRFASIYAYGCHPTRFDNQIKRQDKWSPSSLYPPRDEHATMPSLAQSDEYEAAEPRQLLALSKEVDVLIPNETRQSRLLSSPVTKLGIWRKNIWLTKSALRGKRVANSASDGRQKANDHSIEVSRSMVAITPKNFGETLSHGKGRESKEVGNYTQQLTQDTPSNTMKIFSNKLNASESKINFKRENTYRMMATDAPKETRYLYADETLDSVFPLDFENDSRSWQSKEHIAREMEDVFLRGASQALTRYIEKQLHPAIKETLMLSMGYTISYG